MRWLLILAALTLSTVAYAQQRICINGRCYDVMPQTPWQSAPLPAPAPVDPNPRIYSPVEFVRYVRYYRCPCCGQLVTIK